MSRICAAILCLAGTLHAQLPVSLVLPAPQQEIVLDEARGVLYASLPTRNSIAVVSTQSWTLLEEIAVPANPRGIALSLDGSRLFAAHYNLGQVSALDLATRSYTTISVGTLLNDQRTWDVLEVQPGRLVVTANPSSNGLSYVVQVRLDQGGAQSRIASNRIIRGGPTLEMTRGSRWLYVTEPSFSPDSIYKLDLSLPDAPLVLEDQHGSIGGSFGMAIAPADDKLFLASGQVLSADTLAQISLIAPGGIAGSEASDPTRIWYARLSGSALQVAAYSTTSYALVETVPVPGVLSQISDVCVLPQNRGWILAGDNKLVGVVDPPVCNGGAVQACPGAANSRGSGATLSSTGSTSISANSFALGIDGMPPHSIHQLIYGQGAVQLAFGDGTLCISPYTAPLRRLGPPVAGDAQGHAARQLDFAAPPLVLGPISSYSTWRFQAMYRDPAAMAAGGTGFNMTSALEVSFCP